MIQTYEAMVEDKGHIQLLDRVTLPPGHRVLITVLEEPALSMPETALLSEAALAEDWNRPEEDEAWSYLQSGQSSWSSSLFLIYPKPNVARPLSWQMPGVEIGFFTRLPANPTAIHGPSA